VQPPAGHTQARRPLQWPVLPVLLSKAMDTRPRAAPTLASPARPNERPRVLVVDDSSVARTQLRGMLAMRDCEALEAADVAEALVQLEAARFDCVFMDVLMPGVDGYEGCRQIRARGRGDRATPVVMLTSKASPFDRIRGKMAGCDAYLAKPVDARQLDEVLHQFAPGAHSPRVARGQWPLPAPIRRLPAAG
jgi:two-component system, cell cycle response regulator